MCISHSICFSSSEASTRALRFVLQCICHILVIAQLRYSSINLTGLIKFGPKQSLCILTVK